MDEQLTFELSAEDNPDVVIDATIQTETNHKCAKHNIQTTSKTCKKCKKQC